jgi:hypothetical protein
LAAFAPSASAARRWIDALADELASPVAEELLGLSVDQHDPRLPVDDHDRVWRGLEQAPEEDLAPAHLLVGAPRLAGAAPVGCLTSEPVQG